MFTEVSEEAGRLAREAAVRVCWSQWADWGSPAAATEASGQATIVDPEALILLSLTVRNTELRLGDIVGWWARTGARYTSVQRLRTLARSFPAEAGAGAMAEFAALATEAGDRRWNRHAQSPAPEWVRPDRPTPSPDMLAPSALWPRLRAGLGVGTKADVLVFLLGLKVGSASVSQISAATSYSPVSVRTAAADMSLAHLIRETDWRPAEYAAPLRPWTELLAGRGNGELDSRCLPVWRYWAGLFAYLAWVADWSDRARSADGRREHSLASEAREIVERHARVFGIEGVPVPSMDRFRGRDAALGLLETTRALTSWMDLDGSDR